MRHGKELRIGALLFLYVMHTQSVHEGIRFLVQKPMFSHRNHHIEIGDKRKYFDKWFQYGQWVIWPLIGWIWGFRRLGFSNSFIGNVFVKHAIRQFRIPFMCKYRNHQKSIGKFFINVKPLSWRQARNWCIWAKHQCRAEVVLQYIIWADHSWSFCIGQKYPSLLKMVKMLT